MHIIQKAARSLTAAEDRLRELVAEAAAEGDYEAVLKLTAWAQQLHGLRNGTGTESSAKGATAVPPKPVQGNEAHHPGPRQRGLPPSRERRVARKQTTYPTFTRDGDELVKTGWSKKHRKEYHHRAPRSVLDVVVAAVVAEAEKGQPIATARLFPVKDPSGGTLPDYQVYMCLAWMREDGLLRPQGRQGYEVLAPKELADSIEQRWETLK